MLELKVSEILHEQSTRNAGLSTYASAFDKCILINTRLRNKMSRAGWGEKGFMISRHWYWNCISFHAVMWYDLKLIQCERYWNINYLNPCALEMVDIPGPNISVTKRIPCFLGHSFITLLCIVLVRIVIVIGSTNHNII